MKLADCPLWEPDCPHDLADTEAARAVEIHWPAKKP